MAFTHLPPGRYAFVAEGSNRAGAFSPAPLRIAVEILPAFHQTAWFRGVVALAALALAYGVYRVRVRTLQARARRLEHVVAERTAELSERNAELAAAYRVIEEASLTDPLTKLRNRRFLTQAMPQDLPLAERGPGDLVFLLLDLDHFKSVNDTHGHAAGDAVLVQLAQVLRSTLRHSDHVVRWGGEEFLVVVRLVPRETAPEIAEKVRAAVAAHRFALPGGGTVGKTCSLGFASYPFSRREPRAVPWEEVVEVADLGLYAAKRSGRNAWVGVEAPRGTPVAAAVAAFRDDPERSAQRGAVHVIASPNVAERLTWS